MHTAEYAYSRLLITQLVRSHLIVSIIYSLVSSPTYWADVFAFSFITLDSSKCYVTHIHELHDNLLVWVQLCREA